MRASICIPTYNHSPLLDRTLQSIFAQTLPGDIEFLIANDGSTDDTVEVLAKYPVSIIETATREPGWCSCIAAWNDLFKAARGDAIIMQSDDVIHVTENAVTRLLDSAELGHCTFAATRINDPTEPEPEWGIHGVHNRSPIFMLGIVMRSDVYAVGGFDTRFIGGAWYWDNWFADCLFNAGVVPASRDDIVCYHQPHACGYAERAEQWQVRNRDIYQMLREAGRYVSDTGPWKFTAKR